MSNNRRVLFSRLLFVAFAAGLMSASCSENREPEFKPIPRKAPADARTPAVAGDTVEVGTGWGKGEPEEAVRTALGMALKGKKNRNPDFLIIHATAGSDCQKILQEARSVVGAGTRVYGGTSDARGVLTDGGYVIGAKGGYAAAAADIQAGRHALAVMTISTRAIDFGVSALSLDGFASPQEMAAAAVAKAMRDAGRSADQKPSIILVTPTIGIEKSVLDGISRAIGNDAILLGGTAGGPDGMVIGNGGAYREGVSLALFYTDLPIGWSFESGFEKPDEHSGVVTRMDGRRIVEIDGEPAYEVYDRWLGGEVSRLRQQGEKTDAFRDFLSLHPLFRKRQAPDGKTYTVFSHPWAPNKNLITDGLFPTGDIGVGDRVYLSFGTWEVLMNRVGNLPLDARKSMVLRDKSRIVLGIGTICAGVMGVIPEQEREKFPVLINHSNDEVPFIASFTWGEQGALPGVGYQHCNLTTSFLVIGD